MKAATKLVSIKILHTAIWMFFNAIIIYLVYAVVTNKIGLLVWLGIGFIVFEGIVLLVYKMKCPLTLIARKYTSSIQPNFDIYLPSWLAMNNKIIYTSIFVVTLGGLAYRLVANS